MKRKYTILQEEIADCGVCSLLSIIRYYGGNVPLELLRIESNTNKYGVTAFNLIECAKKYKLIGKGIRTYNIKNIKTPFIAHLNINKSLSHFVVIYKIFDDSLIIMDPAKGMIKESIKEFNESFTGIILEFYPRGKLPIIENKKIINKKITKSIIKETPLLTTIIILNIIYLLLIIISSLYINYINNTLLIFIFIFINILTLYLKYIIDKKTTILMNKVDKTTTDYIFSHILKLPLNYIQFKDSGELIKRIEDVEVIKEIQINIIIKLLLNLMILVPLVILLSFKINYFILILFCFIISYFILNRKYHNNIKELVNKEIDNSTYYNNILINIITGITSIYHSTSNNYFKDKLNKLKENKRESNYKLNKLFIRYNYTNNIIIKILEIILNIILFTGINNKIYQIQDIFIINIIFNLIINSLFDLLSTIPTISIKKSLSNKIDELLNIKNEEEEQINYTNGDILVKKLSFSYNKLNNTLENINTRIKKGEKILIKSKSGYGKTTLFKLLNKELLDYKGIISINDIDIKNIKDLNNKISFISQDEVIFTGTIRENILLGLEVKESYLKKIINLCELNQVIDKKIFGLDTFLYGGGEELSGGEKQLIILARFLIRNKDILIIDESTSELSQDIEDKVLKNIINYYKDKTILFVSHKNKDYLFKRIIKL